MHEQRRQTIEVGYGRIGDQLDTGGAREALQHEEVAVAVHQSNRHPVRGQLVELSGDPCVQRIGKIIVASPVFEQVAQDVEAVRSARGAVQEVEKNRTEVRPLAREVQV